MLVFVGFYSSEKKESDQQEKELQAIVEEDMQDIENGDYEEAHIKAETIYYTGNWSSDIKKSGIPREKS